MKRFENLSFKEYLKEATLSRQEVAREVGDSMSDDKFNYPDESDAPYAVYWTGQSYEWYGNDNMKRGRYKPKGEGGEIVAINVPTYKQAEYIKKNLDMDYRRGTFYNKNVYNTKGEDMYVIHYHGARIVPMSHDFIDKEDIEYQMKYRPNSIKDYSK